MIPLFKVAMSANADKEVSKVLHSGFITQGPQVEKYEEALCKYFEYPYILSVNSATSGLTLALRLLDLPQDSIVLTTPMTCTATNWPILANGFKIKWVDVNPNTCNIDIEDLISKLSENTKAIMVVHWGGYPINPEDLKRVQQICLEKYGFEPAIIEDCAHAFGAKYADKFVGTFGNISVFSTQAIKHLTTVDGGFMMLPNRELYERAKLLRWFGIDRSKRTVSGDLRMEPDIPEWGYKFHMNDVNATIGLANLSLAIENLQKHRENALELREYLKTLKNIMVMDEDPLASSAYWILTIRVKYKNFFIKYMKERNITVSSVHSRNDRHTCVQEFNIDPDSLKGVKILDQEMICIPCGWWLNKEDLIYMKAKFSEWSNAIKFVNLTSSNLNLYFDLMVLHNADLKNLSDEDRNTKLAKIFSQGGTILMIILDGMCVASGKLLIEQKFLDSLGHIEDIFVHPNFRHNGFGKEITLKLLELSEKFKCYKTILNCSKELESFYISCGMKIEGTQMVRRYHNF